MLDLQAWLRAEVKMAEATVANAEGLLETSTASERSGRVTEWRQAKVEARVARQLLAEIAP